MDPEFVRFLAVVTADPSFFLAVVIVELTPVQKRGADASNPTRTEEVKIRNVFTVETKACSQVAQTDLQLAQVVGFLQCSRVHRSVGRNPDKKTLRFHPVEK